MKSIGEILVGFGILFIGMGFMSDAMKPLRSNEGFQRILISMSHPILGVLAGTIMTVILQSSSASVGILQALAAQGLIGLDSSLPYPFWHEHRHMYNRYTGKVLELVLMPKKDSLHAPIH